MDVRAKANVGMSHYTKSSIVRQRKAEKIDRYVTKQNGRLKSSILTKEAIKNAVKK